MPLARATAASTCALIASLALTACSGSSEHASAKARAAAACRHYFSVNGMTGEEAAATYRAGSRLATDAASADSTWQPLATAFAEMSKFNNDIQATDQIPPTEEQPGLSATRFVADTCAKLLRRQG